MAKIGNDRDLAYWLQGYFEIADTTELDATTLKAVALKINEMPEQGPLAKFILQTVLENGFENQGPAIAWMLKETFIHAIDPTIEGDQEQLRRTHQGGDDKPGVVAMCQIIYKKFLKGYSDDNN